MEAPLDNGWAKDICHIIVETNKKIMSKITFRVRSKGEKIAPIKLRLSVSRETVLESNSGYFIYPMNWSTKTKEPIQNAAENKKLKVDLDRLKTFIYGELLADSNANESISIEWLRTKIDEFKILESGKPIEKSERDESDYFVRHIDKYIELAPTKKVNGKLGLALNTVKKYKSFNNLIIRFEKEYLKKRIKFADMDKNFIEKFKKWLLEVNNYSVNHAGKQLDHLKTICRDAMEYDIHINPYILKVQSFKQSNDNRYIVTFSFEEIEKIRNAEMPNVHLENAKNWMLIGFEIGQRAGDLLNISATNILAKEQGILYLNIRQEKTNKKVCVPIINKHTINIIESEFPHPISIQKLNTYIKQVCKLVGLNQPTEGYKFDSQSRRKVFGTFPKYELVTTHAFRRSFATNWYGRMETSLIMEITLHSKESQFKEYINLRENKQEKAKDFALKALEVISNNENKLMKSA
jgi:integrase